MTAPSQRTFVAMMAMLFATIALSIDAMLPALPDIAAELSPTDSNKVLLIISSFFLGMGLGTFVAGPVSDAYGRKPVIFVCAAIYAAATVLCYFAPSLEMLLIARVLQGIGAAAPRVVGMAMVRDLYKGRDMARIVSFVMMIFMIVPALAPLLGQGILLFGDWRTIFAALLIFVVIANSWVLLGQPETLSIETRRPFRPGLLWQSAVEMSRHRIALISTLCQGLGSACLLATVSSQQGIFAQTFDRADSFPLWFGFIALCAASGSLLNSRVVMRLGMRRVIVATYAAQVGFTVLILALDWSGLMPAALVFPAHVLWSITVFAMMGLTQGNLAALAMEDLGHIAGFAASMMTALSTVMAALLAVPVGLAFDGTQIPLMVAVSVFSALALALVSTVRR
ncbi:MAG: multidrug effflux MFS transporter [Rhodobacteraceae bacterium]|nr:multidrug effflux MFS transporter [Paracoccaceae bacterium]